MGNVANQRSVEVVKEVCNKNNNYATINLDALEKASCELNGVAFKLWVFFSKNQDKFVVDMWINNLENFGIKDGGSYDRAWKELKAKGYIIPESGTTKFKFYEVANTHQNGINTIPTKTELDSHQNGGMIPTKTEPIATKMVGEYITDNTNNNTNIIQNENETVIMDEPEVESSPKVKSSIATHYNLSDKYVTNNPTVLELGYDEVEAIIESHNYELSKLDMNSGYESDAHRFNSQMKLIKSWYDSAQLEITKRNEEIKADMQRVTNSPDVFVECEQAIPSKPIKSNNNDISMFLDCDVESSTDLELDNIANEKLYGMMESEIDKLFG